MRLGGMWRGLRRTDGNAYYRRRVLAILLVAVSVGLDNFAAAIGIGLSGLDAKLRLQVAIVFGVFEAGCDRRTADRPLAHHLLGATRT